jgi:hypothetical protein
MIDFHDRMIGYGSGEAFLRAASAAVVRRVKIRMSAR